MKKKGLREEKERDKERRHKVTGRETEAERSDSVPKPGLNTNSFIC